jgi:hypothetical protein
MEKYMYIMTKDGWKQLIPKNCKMLPPLTDDELHPPHAEVVKEGMARATAFEKRVQQYMKGKLGYEGVW